MTHSARCTYNTRLAGWMSAFIAAATFFHLHSAYERIPIVVPIGFEDGSPMRFAMKSPELVYLPFGLQVTLGLILAAVVVVVLGQRGGAAPHDVLRRAAAQHTAEGVALLAAIWIGFQAVNAWRLTELWRRTFDPFVELYVVALITAFTATVTIGLRVVLKMQDSGVGGESLRAPVVDGQRPLAMAGLAVLLAIGIGAPALLLSMVWETLRQF